MIILYNCNHVSLHPFKANYTSHAQPPMPLHVRVARVVVSLSSLVGPIHHYDLCTSTRFENKVKPTLFHNPCVELTWQYEQRHCLTLSE